MIFFCRSNEITDEEDEEKVSINLLLYVVDAPSLKSHVLQILYMTFFLERNTFTISMEFSLNDLIHQILRHLHRFCTTQLSLNYTVFLMFIEEIIFIVYLSQERQQRLKEEEEEMIRLSRAELQKRLAEIDEELEMLRLRKV